jgi:hypothetical protein
MIVKERFALWTSHDKRRNRQAERGGTCFLDAGVPCRCEEAIHA